jgi:methylisocitrate lyase
LVFFLPPLQSKAALTVYEGIIKEGTQKNVVPLMQTRAELYESVE